MAKSQADSEAVDAGGEMPTVFATRNHHGSVVLVPQPSDDPNDPLVGMALGRLLS
jgi:hypothetical protein